MPITEQRHDNGLPFLTLSTAAAEVDVFLQGAQLTRYRPTGEPDLLWVSSAEDFQPGKPIRGGIPICWPWFGAHPDDATAPAHGLVRSEPWQWQEVTDNPERCEITLSKQISGAHPAFPHKATVQLTIGLGSDLSLALTTINQSDSAFVLSQALHSYFAVNDIQKVQLTGLGQCPYYDKVTGERALWPEQFAFDREIDRIVQDSGQVIELHQPGSTGVVIERSGSESVVIWNPWVEKSKRLSNFNDDDYRHMLCIESANADQDTRLIAPGDAHTLSTTLRPLKARLTT